MAALRNALISETLVTFTTDTKTPEDVAGEIAERPYFAVAEAQGRIVGYAFYGPFRSGPGYAGTIEHGIHVADRATGQGTGTHLMDNLEAHAKASGSHVIVAGISSANPRSITFHARRGFVEVGRMPEVGRKWDQWLDLILMQKRL